MEAHQYEIFRRLRTEALRASEGVRIRIASNSEVIHLSSDTDRIQM